MTDDLVPSRPVADGLVPARAASAAWAPPEPAPPVRAAASIGRYLAALRRYKWPMLGIVAAGVVAGVIAARVVDQKYDVRATIWISSETPIDNAGPIRSRELLNSEAWVELLKSYRIADAVVTKLALFVQPASVADSAAFRGFALADRFAPGEYTLNLDGARRRFTLALNGRMLDSGAIGDSIGRPVGFRWAPSAQALRAGGGEREIAFAVTTPRESAIELMQRLGSRLPERSNFLWLTFQDTDPRRAAQILNAWAREYVAVAGELKRRNITEFANILEGQLRFAEGSLKGAEASLEGFRVRTVILPSEATPVAAGLEMTRDPVLSSYFQRNIDYDNLRHDRQTLEALLARGGSADSLQGALLLPSVADGPGGEQLRDLFKQLYQKRAELAAARQTYTDEFRGVRDLQTVVQTLERQAIPRLAGQLLAQVREREAQASQRIQAQGRDLQKIPTRTIEEMRLRRRVAVAEGLYTTLQTRYAEARLAEASTTPDVSILDSAVAPLRPTSDSSVRTFGLAVLASFAAAIGLALLLDRLDGRVRYPEHASGDLGLAIVGAVPTLPRPGSTPTPEGLAQLVESFRSIRMGLVYAVRERPLTVAVTSAGAGDGKSLVCANVALSFAEAGFRTILVDGDTRRGALHATFGVPAEAGLTDYLAGDVTLDAILHQTSHAGLVVAPRGRRRQHGPELLTSAAMQRLMGELERRSDVVIFDTPPLAAGIDAFAIGSAARNLLMVLRVGRTERRLANAKLELMDRLPVRIVGAVLNDVELKGEYQYYGYLEGYGTEEEAQRPGALVEQT